MMLQAKTNWITAIEAADIIGCTALHVAYLCRVKELRCEKFGRDWAIDPASAKEYAKRPQTAGRPRNHQPA